MTTRSTPLVLFLLAAACATPAIEESNAYPELVTAMHDLQSEQQRFAATTVLPQTFAFPGQGRVVARIVSLDGYPGNTYVRCRFHYFNDTGKPVTRALVSLDVLDGAGRMVASQVSVCIFPTPRAIYPGSLRTDSGTSAEMNVVGLARDACFSPRSIIAGLASDLQGSICSK